VEKEVIVTAIIYIMMALIIPVFAGGVFFGIFRDQKNYVGMALSILIACLLFFVQIVLFIYSDRKKSKE